MSGAKRREQAGRRQRQGPPGALTGEIARSCTGPPFQMGRFGGSLRQTTEGRFDEQAGETSAVINQSLINGGPNFVEVQPMAAKI